MADRGDARRVEEITGRLDDRLDMLVVLVSELEADDANGAEAMLSVPDGGDMEPLLVEETAGQGRGHGQPQNRAGLRVAVAGSAANNHMVMWAMLDEVPQSVREALLEAIAVLEDGYEDVLQALE